MRSRPRYIIDVTDRYTMTVVADTTLHPISAVTASEPIPTRAPISVPSKSFLQRPPIAPAIAPTAAPNPTEFQPGNARSIAHPITPARRPEATILTQIGCGRPGTRLASAHPEIAAIAIAPTAAPDQTGREGIPAAMAAPPPSPISDPAMVAPAI